jgi:hypothetical protein
MDAIDSGIPVERIKQSPLAVRVDAALAQPEPEGATDAELIMMWATTRYIDQPEGGLAYGRSVLTRWGRPAIEPVPVGERWPEFSDCDQQELVWAWNPILDHWKLTRLNRSIHTHWLPHHALPVPSSPTLETP